MDPTVAQPAMPQMPEAQPDPFGGLVQAIALGFAAGFGGKSVQDQIAETRRQSWEAWMRKQDVALRREEMDRRDRQFAMSLDMQRTQLEFSKAADERAAARAEASDKAAQGRFDMTFKADREDKLKAEAERTRSEAGLAQVGVQTGVLPFDTLFATPQMLDAARGAKADEAAQGRFDAERLDRQNFQARAQQADESKQAFEVWRTLRAENADVRNLDSQFRAQAVQLARDDMTAGRTTSFEGSVEEYLKLFGRAGAAAKSGSVDMREALEAVKSGDFSRLDELRTAAPAAPESRPTDSRPTGRSNGQVPPFGAVGGGKASAIEQREKSRSDAAAQRDEAVRKDIASRVDDLDDNELRKFEGMSRDEVVDAVLAEYRAVRDEADKKSGFRTVGAVGPARARSISEAIKRALASRRK